jgi:hypothetical protein
LPEIAPSGKPLPPLVDLEIYAHTKEFSHLTQDMGDRVLQIAYDDVYVGASLHVTVEDADAVTRVSGNNETSRSQCSRRTQGQSRGLAR